MKFQVLLSPAAEDDAFEIEAWYESKKPGLGAVFVQSLGRSLQTLTAFPHLEIRYDNIRFKGIDRFPHLLHFWVDDEERIVEVIAILHPAQDPRSAAKR